MTRLTLCVLLVVGLPLLAPAQDKPKPAKQDEKKDAQPDKDAEQAKLEAQQKLQATLKELLLQPCSLGDGNVVNLSYPFSEPQETEDWKARGFDKFDVNQVESTHNEVALELGAGSRKTGTALHKLPLRGDFTITVSLFVPVTAPSSVLCFLLGKKVGVNWGQQIVKPRSLKPYNRRSKLKKTVYREERKVTLKFERKGTTLTIKCNGVVSDKRTFKKGELDGIQVGVMVRNIRVAITDFEIKGVVDAEAVLKQAGKKKKKKKKNK